MKLDVVFYDGMESIDLTNTLPDPRYEVLSSNARKNVKYYPCCVEPYPDLTFNFEVELLSGTAIQGETLGLSANPEIELLTETASRGHKMGLSAGPFLCSTILTAVVLLIA